ncbi:hypothetical protein ES288_A05G295500v1 [Gossypium darwinii]|uniref:Uncharacterized protein n=2 Tax=Gossypium TaxID=3633 RepID=A0A5D2QKN3_GOSTO|nr:hypothetical protein ES288_A05G295500v1 [Gossypium darwinii]TYI29197.1 hypothetical protein ES332_A05G299600v1 [Gossypium tomentosum]
MEQRKGAGRIRKPAIDLKTAAQHHKLPSQLQNERIIQEFVERHTVIHLTCFVPTKLKCLKFQFRYLLLHLSLTGGTSSSGCNGRSGQ